MECWVYYRNGGGYCQRIIKVWNMKYIDELKYTVKTLLKGWAYTPEYIKSAWDSLISLSNSIMGIILSILFPFLIPLAPIFAVMQILGEKRREKALKKTKEHYFSHTQTRVEDFKKYR